MTSKTKSVDPNCALITGASSGIGLACAERLAEQGVNLILTARREDRLNALAARLREKYSVEVTTAVCDLTDRASVEVAFTKIAGPLANISILVNNAGLALGTEPLASGNLDDWEKMIDTNVKGLLTVTRLSLPHMLKNNRGHVVNIGSVAGRWVYPGGAVYCATKFAVRALTEGLRMDLLGTGLRVTNIEPGMVETEFSEVRFQGNKDKAKSVYQGIDALSADDIAEAILWCVQRPPHVNIQELVIYPTDQAAVGPYVHRRT